MQWSKLKSRVKSFIAPELRHRIDFHLTSYRRSHDGADKVWITVDGERVFDCKHYPREWAEADLYQRGLERDEISPALAAAEIHGPADFGNAMRIYLRIPVEEALRSSDPIVRAFAIIDRRVGKRTLEKLEVSDADHTLVKMFYDVRSISGSE
ncbi:MAG: hypothetical protein IPM63_05475 [Acidobacteriota bacterium]|nr:MAG: hypothetical protein IPM63_05475 [Acidobacteriota bacterium]